MTKYTIKGWIACSEAGFLYFFRKKPKRIRPIDDYGYWESNDMYDDPLDITDASEFDDVSWEGGPKRVELTIKTK